MKESVYVFFYNWWKKNRLNHAHSTGLAPFRGSSLQSVDSSVDICQVSFFFKVLFLFSVFLAGKDFFLFFNLAQFFWPRFSEVLLRDRTLLDVIKDVDFDWSVRWINGSASVSCVFVSTVLWACAVEAISSVFVSSGVASSLLFCVEVFVY